MQIAARRPQLPAFRQNPHLLSFAGSAILREEIERVDPAKGVAAQLEVQMGARAVASAAHSSDHIPLENRLTAPNVDLAVVSIQRLPAVAVVDHDGVAVAPVIPASIDHNPIVGSRNSAASAATTSRASSG